MGMDETIIFDKRYELTASGFGSWFISREHRLPLGTVRCIRGALFKVQYQHGVWYAPITCWIPANEDLNTLENLREFRARVAEGKDQVRLVVRPQVAK